MDLKEWKELFKQIKKELFYKTDPQRQDKKGVGS